MVELREAGRRGDVERGLEEKVWVQLHIRHTNTMKHFYEVSERLGRRQRRSEQEFENIETEFMTRQLKLTELS